MASVIRNASAQGLRRLSAHSWPHMGRGLEAVFTWSQWPCKALVPG